MLRRLLTPLTILACSTTATIATPASAQRLVYAIGANHAVLDLATGATTPLSADEAQLGAVITSDGRFAVRPQSTWAVTVRDLTTGQQVAVPTFGFTPLLAHPRHPALFGWTLGGRVPARLDARGEAAFTGLCPVPGGSPWMDLSIDGGTLFVLCYGMFFVLDSDTGVERYRIPMTEIGGRFAVNASGTEVVGWSPALPPELVRVDATTGAVLQRRTPAQVGGPGAVMPTPARDRVIATSCRPVSVNYVCAATLVDAATLAEVRNLGESNGTAGPAVDISPDGQDAFVSGFGYAFSSSFAQWVDVASGAIRASVSVPTADGGISIDYRAAPLPPVLALGAPGGGAVSMTWTLPDASPQVTGYRLEAGFAPGDTAASIDLGPEPLVTIPGVPPGRYYARLRAVNYNGVSAASNEVVIDVP